jgi:hypothetical protein
MFAHMATISCGDHVLGIRIVADAHTIDDAIAGQDAERTGMLQAGAGNVKRTDRLYRRAYENYPGGGTNYWVDVIVAIDGRVFVCQAGSMAPKGTRALADQAGDLCETLSAMK